MTTIISTSTVAQEDILSVYTEGDNIQRSVLRFDIVPGVTIPAGAVDINATLTLHFDNTIPYGGNPNHVPMDIYRITTDWTESQVTWNVAKTGVPWVTPGGDYTGILGGGPYATTSENVTTDGAAVTWTDPALGQLVDEWNSGEPNYGMLLMSGQSNNMVFYTGENSPNLRPTMLVTYEMPLDDAPAPEPITMLAMVSGIMALGGYVRKRVSA